MVALCARLLANAKRKQRKERRRRKGTKKTDIIDNPGAWGYGRWILWGRESSEKKGREKIRSGAEERYWRRCGGQYLREGLGSAEFQPRDVIAPAGCSDLLGYYGSCVRKVRARGVWISFGRSAIPVAYKMATVDAEKETASKSWETRKNTFRRNGNCIRRAPGEFSCLWPVHIGARNDSQYFLKNTWHMIVRLNDNPRGMGSGSCHWNGWNPIFVSLKKPWTKDYIFPVDPHYHNSTSSGIVLEVLDTSVVHVITGVER